MFTCVLLVRVLGARCVWGLRARMRPRFLLHRPPPSYLCLLPRVAAASASWAPSRALPGCLSPTSYSTCATQTTCSTSAVRAGLDASRKRCCKPPTLARQAHTQPPLTACRLVTPHSLHARAEGHVEEAGSYEELMAAGGRFAELMAQAEVEEVEEAVTAVDATDANGAAGGSAAAAADAPKGAAAPAPEAAAPQAPAQQGDGQLVQAESRSTGSVSAAVVMAYVNAMVRSVGEDCPPVCGLAARLRVRGRRSRPRPRLCLTACRAECQQAWRCCPRLCWWRWRASARSSGCSTGQRSRMAARVRKGCRTECSERGKACGARESDAHLACRQPRRPCAARHALLPRRVLGHQRRAGALHAHLSVPAQAPVGRCRAGAGRKRGARAVHLRRARVPTPRLHFCPADCCL